MVPTIGGTATVILLFVGLAEFEILLVILLLFVGLAGIRNSACDIISIDISIVNGNVYLNWHSHANRNDCLDCPYLRDGWRMKHCCPVGTQNA